MFSVAVNTDNVTSADVVFCNKESFDVAQKFILRDFYGRLFQGGPKHLPFLDGCTEYSLHKYYIKTYGEMQNTHDNSPREKKTFFNLFCTCFGFEFASFVPDACLAERKSRSYKRCVSHQLGTTSNINVKITWEGVLLLIKFQADVLQNNKNNTPPDESLTFCNETNYPK